MKFTSRSAYDICSEWVDEGKYAIAYPAIWDGTETVVCRSIAMTPAARLFAEHKNGQMRAIFALLMLRSCKRETLRQAAEAGVHVAL